MKTRMLGFLLGVWVAGGVWCRADEASHRQRVEELFRQLDMATTLNQTIAQVAGSMAEALPMEAGYQEVVDAYVRRYADWDALKDDLVTIYAQAFTAEEVQELIHFYNTAVGRKLLAQAPGISREIAALVHGRLTEHRTELKQMMMDADFMAFKKALAADLDPAAMNEP